MASPELLAPAGDWDCVRAAVANGADAVYFGLTKFNARLRAENFSLEDLPKVVAYVHARGVKAYVTMNTLLFTGELAEAEEFLLALDKAGVDAAIVQDLGLAALAAAAVPGLEIHASTQMTITSPEGAQIATRLGVTRIVLARELSMREMERFQDSGAPPLEVFVHGALCVAYSGQCLTSESLGQRSANRGECAQACRLPYELIVDGAVKELGERRYLLSPQDLAAVAEIPRLVELGVASFKIEGRLKAPEYVAAVCQVYRKAIDAALAGRPTPPDAEDKRKLELTFSRGLFSGWMHGVDHQQLVQGRWSNKRGPLAAHIRSVDARRQTVEVVWTGTPLRPGDGVLFDAGGDQNNQQGGRIWEVRGTTLAFERDRIDFTRLAPGQAIHQTDDPRLDAALQKSFAQDRPVTEQPLFFVVSGKAGEPLRLGAKRGGTFLEFQSSMPLQAARNQPLDTERLWAQLGRLGGSGFVLAGLENHLEGAIVLPVAELNRLRREAVAALEKIPAVISKRPPGTPALARLLPPRPAPVSAAPECAVLCRTLEQLDALLDAGARTLYVDFEDIRRYKEAVARARQTPGAAIYLATPRIQKSGEQGFFKLIENAAPDGVLIRNLGALHHFKDSPLRRIGDFSLNVANPLTAQLLMAPEWGLERITASYDLNAVQLGDLLAAVPPAWLEIVLHQHMPLFHMEHCVFAAFLSEGKDHTTCGRPCDRHQIAVRDRVGATHPVLADVGCRNTVYHGRAQSGAAFLEEFRQAGAHHFRLELLREDAAATRRIYETYCNLLTGALTPATLRAQLQVADQLGVTSGTLTVLGK